MPIIPTPKKREAKKMKIILIEKSILSVSENQR
jgi:hypothetical protein